VQLLETQTRDTLAPRLRVHRRDRDALDHHANEGPPHELARKTAAPKMQPPTRASAARCRGLWIKCPSCDTVLYKTTSTRTRTSARSATTTRIGARARLDVFLIRGSLRDRPGSRAGRRTQVQGQQEVHERLRDALEATGETDALIVVGGAVHTIPVVAACFEFDFMGGSMGSVVGERFVRASRPRSNRRCRHLLTRPAARACRRVCSR